MNNKPINELTNEELLRNAKIIRAMVIMLVVFSSLLLLASIYLVASKGFNVICVIPIALLPIILLNVNNLNKFRKEIKNREL